MQYFSTGEINISAFLQVPILGLLTFQFLVSVGNTFCRNYNVYFEQWVGAERSPAEIRSEAFDFDISLECPAEVLVNNIFSCVFETNGINRRIATIQCEDQPPINREFKGKSNPV